MKGKIGSALRQNRYCGNYGRLVAMEQGPNEIIYTRYNCSTSKQTVYLFTKNFANTPNLIFNFIIDGDVHINTDYLQTIM